MAKEAADPYQASIEAVWYDPTTYDPMVHGPEYLPPRVRLASDKKAIARKVASQMVDKRAVQSLMGGVATLQGLLAVLRAASFVHQTHHWQTNGGHYYADHLLFQRLYEESQDFIDQLAERTVGTYGPHEVDAVHQVRLMVDLVAGMNPGSLDPDVMIERSLATESFVVQSVSAVLDRLEETGQLTNGTDNLLQGISDLHEGFLYLLQQRVSQPKAYEYGR